MRVHVADPCSFMLRLRLREDLVDWLLWGDWKYGLSFDWSKRVAEGSDCKSFEC